MKETAVSIAQSLKTPFKKRNYGFMVQVIFFGKSGWLVDFIKQEKDDFDLEIRKKIKEDG